MGHLDGAASTRGLGQPDYGGVADENRRAAKRSADVDDWRYMNSGIALWPGFALRLGRPPELTRITLRRVA